MVARRREDRRRNREDSAALDEADEERAVDDRRKHKPAPANFGRWRASAGVFSAPEADHVLESPRQIRSTRTYLDHPGKRRRTGCGHRRFIYGSESGLVSWGKVSLLLEQSRWQFERLAYRYRWKHRCDFRRSRSRDGDGRNDVAPASQFFTRWTIGLFGAKWN